MINSESFWLAIESSTSILYFLLLCGKIECVSKYQMIVITIVYYSYIILLVYIHYLMSLIN